MMAALDFYFQVRLFVFNIGLLDETFTEHLTFLEISLCESLLRVRQEDDIMSVG